MYQVISNFGWKILKHLDHVLQLYGCNCAATPAMGPTFHSNLDVHACCPQVRCFSTLELLLALNALPQQLAALRVSCSCNKPICLLLPTCCPSGSADAACL